MPLSETPPLLQARQNMMFLMGQLNRQWRRVVDRRLRPVGLTEATWLPLTRLERATGPMRQKDLAASLGLDSSSVVRLLDGLEAAGLIERAGHADRRAKTIDITPKGEDTLRQVKQLLQQERGALFQDIPEEDLLKAFEVMSLLGERLLQMEQPDAAGALA
ncbi:MarR family transcriptional regulator [Diaphorobacter ruginosibacter]|uniref:MarR family winged helix-turn-helix transcriptional regulator n=1 Tax=Diaphorobacter ruginosibacter TaxID=1715720 RepID=UPI00333FCA24